MESQPKEPLLRDLDSVLEYEVQFTGKFAYSMVVPDCPNPGLDVDGVGRVALPLTDHTAKLIASAGDQAPYGHGMDTVVDTTVRDTIQIDASSFHFTNPKWAPVIQKWVEGKVWSKLGCAPFTSPPRCEPYKLLLYKPGAHFLPHQDTEKAAGMFATLVVILPSEFTGGEIHVSHGGESKVFDNAKDSAFETTILAWYTDVTHEVKEITSGYRLALSYHLIDTASGINVPHLPNDDSSLQRLREVFSKWSRDEYPSSKDNRVVAYGFTHLYSDVSLRNCIMKGEDHYVASIVKQAGDLEGVLVLMGWLNIFVEGCTGDQGWQTYEGYGGSPEYGPHAGGTHDDPVMSHVYEAKVWVDGIRDLQGRRVEITKIKLERHSILPYRAFSGESPDDSKLGDPFWGNEGASLEFAYKRAALVMFPKKKQLSLMLSQEGGVKWALQELETSKSEGASAANCEIIDFFAQQKRKDLMPTILETAFGWDDAVVWGRIVEKFPEFFLEQEGYKHLCDGWEAFKFDGVRPTFETLFQQRRKLQKTSIDFLLFVKEKLPFGVDPQKDEWISAQATRAMETFDPTEDSQLHPGVTDIVRWKGLQFASDVVQPRFPDKRDTYDHRTNLGMELIKYKEELIALPRAEGQTASNAELLDHILDKIIVSTGPKVLDRNSPWPQEVFRLLSICIRGNRTKVYGDLLDLLCRPQKKSFYTRYVELYARTISDLVKLLGNHGIGVSSSPSCKLFRRFIEMYLQEILGSKEGSPCLKPSMLTCGHEGCSQVNDFLRSDEEKKTFPLKWETERCVRDLQIGREHNVFDRDSHWGRTPASMDLTKTHHALAAQKWNVRVADAREVLRGIGTDEEVSQIMGERYGDVEKALEGSKAFVITEIEREEGDEAMDGVE